MDLAGGVADWTSTTTAGNDRICRGGSWQRLDVHARAASRHAMSPTAVSFDVGFRLARDP
jgi:formylglycine-generating enzyme required for sulfatase activity